jgi:hypothetical protein
MNDWETVRVKGLGKLVEAMERADDKGYLPDAIREEWDAFMLDIADGGKGEAVYQMQLRGPDWADVEKRTFDDLPRIRRRIVYTAPQAECAPREAQPVAWMVLASNTRKPCEVTLHKSETEALRQDCVIPLYAAPTPERADADTAGAKPSQDWIDGYAEGKIVARQLAAAGASQERADAGKDAALTDAARDVLAERQRQMDKEGWTPKRDDRYVNEELALAAIVYAESAVGYHTEAPDTWPWHPDWFKPTTPRRDLVKACALLIAEIERTDRAILAANKEPK